MFPAAEESLGKPTQSTRIWRFFGSLAIEHKEEGKKLSHDEGAMLKAAAITTESAEETKLHG